MPDRQPSSSRRKFFAGAATVRAPTAAVAPSPRIVPAEAVVAEVAPVAIEKGGGYYVSDHVKQYYKTTQL